MESPTCSFMSGLSACLAVYACEKLGANRVVNKAHEIRSW